MQKADHAHFSNREKHEVLFWGPVLFAKTRKKQHSSCRSQIHDTQSVERRIEKEDIEIATSSWSAKSHIVKYHMVLIEIPEGTISNLVFTNNRKCGIQLEVNLENNMPGGFSSTTEQRRVTRRLSLHSAMVCAAVATSGRLPPLFIRVDVKLKQLGRMPATLD